MTRMKLIVLTCSLLAPLGVFAADHIDGPGAAATPSADIADHFSWMSPDSKTLNVALTVAPFAGKDATFSDALVYAVHVGSSETYGGPEQEMDILCVFPDGSNIECWMGGEYLSGDASNPQGVVSDSGGLRAYAGLRDDPFFFEFAGFNATVSAVVGAAPSLTFDAHGCPAVDPETSAALVQQLQRGPDDAPASNALAGGNVLALVLAIDVDRINAGGTLLSTWSSTHRMR